MTEWIASLWLGRQVMVITRGDGMTVRGRLTHVNSRRAYLADGANPPRVQSVVLSGISSISAPLAH